MLYVVPASSALHFDPHPHYHYRQESHLSFIPSYYDYLSSDVGQGILAGKGLCGCNQQRSLFRSRQIAERDRRSLYQSVYAAEQREIARRRRQDEEAELIRALAVAARRKQAEEAARRQRAVIEHRRQRKLLQSLLVANSDASQSSSLPGPQDGSQPAAALRRARPVRHPNSFTTFVNGLNTRLQRESDPEVADTIQSILTALSPHKSTSTESTPRQDKGKGKASVVNVVEPVPEPRTSDAEVAMQEYLRSFFQPVPRSGESGPSGTKTEDVPAKEEKHVSFKEPFNSSAVVSLDIEPAVPASEQTTAADLAPEVAQHDRKSALSSIQQIQTELNNLKTDFKLPASLDHYSPSALENDDTVSASSTVSDMSRLLPYTASNAGVYAYENALNTLLERLDSVQSGGDSEVREARRGVVRNVETALRAVESAVEDEVAKRADLSKDSVVGPEDQSTIPVVENPAHEISKAESPSVGHEIYNGVITPAILLREAPGPDTSDGSVAEILHPISQSPFVDPAEQSRTSVLSHSQDNLVPESESQANEPLVMVGKIDTFLLPASPPVSPKVGIEGAEVEVEADEVVIVAPEDLERNGDDWFEVET